MRGSTLSDGSRRVISGCVVALLLVVMTTPLWSTRMEAPQYKDEEALHVYLRLGRVEGDLREIELLNQYVGVHLRLDVPELRIAPWWAGAMVALGVAGLLLGGAGRPKRLLRTTFVVMALGGVAGVGAMQYRLYQIGHDRTRSPFARVENFTPPILGSKKIANFTVYTKPEWGGWALAAAFGLTAWGAFARDPQGPPALS